MIRFADADLSQTSWTAVTGNWASQDQIHLHNPEGVHPHTFNFYLNSQSASDGAIEASVRVTQRPDAAGCLVCRYGPRGCYYAGIGGWGRHLVIAKHVRDVDRELSMMLDGVGSESDIRSSTPYRLRLEFVGQRITLRRDNVVVLDVADNWFSEGHLGFEAFGPTSVEFDNTRVFEVPPIGALVGVLEAFPQCLKRDLQFRGEALQDEKDVQRVLWTVLRSHYPDLVDEETLGKFGLKHYQDDFGIPSLRTIVEVKLVRKSTDLKRLQEELMTDVVGYFNQTTVYRHLVIFIYNQGVRAIDSSMISALESLDRVAAVVIVPGVTP